MMDLTANSSASRTAKPWPQRMCRNTTEMLWPTLQAVAELGGSASIGEIVETVIKREGFSNAQQAVLHNNGPGTEIGYRLAWARTDLKGMGLLTNSTRGVWALTDEGTALITDPSATDEQRRGAGPREMVRLPGRTAQRAEGQTIRRRQAGPSRKSRRPSSAGKSSCSISS